MADTLVLITRAEPTGLVLAIWSARLRVTVRIVDKTSEAGTTCRALAAVASKISAKAPLLLQEQETSRPIA